MVGFRLQWTYLDLGFIYLAQENALYAARFKSWTGGRGTARK